jgi:hypothetical protein
MGLATVLQFRGWIERKSVIHHIVDTGSMFATPIKITLHTHLSDSIWVLIFNHGRSDRPSESRL